MPTTPQKEQELKISGRPHSNPMRAAIPLTIVPVTLPL